MARKKPARAERRPLYQHVDGTVWRRVSERPLVLEPALRSANSARILLSQTRRPTPQTFARDYTLMEGLS